MITDKLKPIGATSAKETVRVSGIVKSASSPGGGTGETDPTVPAHVKAITEEQIETWDTMSGSGYQPQVFIQPTPSDVWGPFTHGLGRAVSVDLIDSLGNEFDAAIEQNHPAYTTFTVRLGAGLAISGRAIAI